MIDPIVHAALVTVFAFLVKLLFNAIGIDVDASAYNAIAGVIVAYILSLFGWSLYARARARFLFKNSIVSYVPPFYR